MPSSGKTLVWVLIVAWQRSSLAIKDIHDHASVETRHGVFLANVKRMGLALPLLPKLQLKTGDELHFVGRPQDLDRVQSNIGYKISAGVATDFISFGFTVTYAVANVFQTLWGPIIVGIITTNATP